METEENRWRFSGWMGWIAGDGAPVTPAEASVQRGLWVSGQGGSIASWTGRVYKVKAP